MRSLRTRALIRKIAEDENLTIKQVEEIVFSFFHFTSNKMKEGDKYTRTYEPIRLFKFGIFKVKQGRINQLKRRDEKLDRNKKRTTNNLTRSSNNQRVQKGLESGPIKE